MTGKLGNTNNTAFNDADLLKGFAENQTTCEDVCAEKKKAPTIFSSNPFIASYNYTLNYFRCYGFNKGNKEKLADLPTTGSDVICSQRMIFYIYYSNINSYQVNVEFFIMKIIISLLLCMWKNSCHPGSNGSRSKS